MSNKVKYHIDIITPYEKNDVKCECDINIQHITNNSYLI